MGALIPLAITVAPEIAKWLFGSSAATTTAAVAKVVQQVTGSADAAGAQAAIDANPALSMQLRVELAKIAAQAEQDARAAELSTITAQLADMANARAQTVALANGHSAVAWSASVISAVVLLTFGLVMFLALTRAMPTGSETLLNMLMGTLAAMATSVVSYWVGSSIGNDRKDAASLGHQSSRGALQ